MDQLRIERIVEVLLTAGRLKRTKRTGWVERGIPEAESVADHSFRVALMALLLSPVGLDRGKILKMAVLHDLAESVVGDLTPQSPDYPSKPQREFTVLKALLAPFDEKEEFLELWSEFETGLTPEARFVREIDRLEAAVQATEYKRDCPDKDSLNIFITNAEQVVSTPLLKKIVRELKCVLEEDQPLV